MKAIVFGATESAQRLYKRIRDKYEIVAYCDNDRNKWGKQIGGIYIISPEKIFKFTWDEIIIVSLSAMNAIKEQLLSAGVPENRINTGYIELQIGAREAFLRDFAQIVYQLKIEGCVAEAGVFQGEFAKVINESFPDRRLYLFDTFEGFNEKDIIYEEENQYSKAKPGYLSMTSPEMVLKKMKYPEMCRIRKGYFPDTTEGIEEKFVFVNLDMDVYKPTREALFWFWPLMIKGGIIMIHDFFSDGYLGIAAALHEFQEKYKVVPFPVGDTVSIAIQKG